MDQQSKQSAYGDEITLRDLLAEISASKILLCGLIAVFVLGGVAIGLLSTRKYEASTVLAPATEQSSSRLGGLSALASQYSGLASLAGITLPGRGEEEEAIAVLKSELLVQRFISENNLLPVLYPNLWDPATKKWRTSDPNRIPTLWKAYRYFDKSILRVLEEKTDLVTLTIEWRDPKQAASWANQLVNLTNSYLREKAIEEAERNIAYLNEQAAQTNVVEARSAIYSLLQEEINKEMIARGRTQYALKVIDPAFAPERPSSAGPVVLGLLGFGLGCVVAVLVAFGRCVLFR